METTKLTLKLAVPMTPAKKLELHEEITTRLAEISEIEEQKKRIRPLKDRIEEVRLSLMAETVEADIECEEVFDNETGLYKTWRLDTNTVFKTRPCDPEERQVKIPGVETDARKRIEELNKTEEQVAAGTPEEAEQLREVRLAEEKATRAFDSLRVGDEVEILEGDQWNLRPVDEKDEHKFAVGQLLYHPSNFGVSWRRPTSWDDVVSESQERERLASIAALAADQADDDKKTKRALLKAPPRKRVKVVDEKDEPIVPPAELPAATEMCEPNCSAQHVHSEQRTAF